MQHSPAVVLPIHLLFLLSILTPNFAVESIGGDQSSVGASTALLLNMVNTNTSSNTSSTTTGGGGGSSANVSPPQQQLTEPKSPTFVHHFLSLSRILTRKRSENSLPMAAVVREKPANGSEVEESDQRKNDIDKGADQLEEIFLSSDEKSPNSDQPTESTQSQSFFGQHVLFAEYWHSVQEFYKRKISGSHTFVLEVPPKVIAKIVLRMIDALLGHNNDKNGHGDGDLGAILEPQNFMVHRKSAITKQFAEHELMGDVQVIYKKDLLPKTPFTSLYDFFYKSPQQIVKDNNNDATKLEESDIVWTLGIVMYGMLTNSEHPFEGLKGQILDENEQNKSKSIGIQKLILQYKIIVDSSGKVWGRGQQLGDDLQKVIISLMKKGEELPIPYEQTMPNDDELTMMCHKDHGDDDSALDQYVCVNGYEPLISLTKQCLQTYKNKRIGVKNLRKHLQEIARDK